MMLRAEYKVASSPGFTAFRLSITMSIGFTFPRRKQVVHHEIHTALLAPIFLVFAPTVKQVENRIMRARILVIVGGHVDKTSTPISRDFGVIPALAHLPMRHIFERNSNPHPARESQCRCCPIRNRRRFV